jgi:hypothetical protein
MIGTSADRSPILDPVVSRPATVGPFAANEQNATVDPRWALWADGSCRNVRRARTVRRNAWRLIRSDRSLRPFLFATGERVGSAELDHGPPRAVISPVDQTRGIYSSHCRRRPRNHRFHLRGRSSSRNRAELPAANPEIPPLRSPAEISRAEAEKEESWASEEDPAPTVELIGTWVDRGRIGQRRPGWEPNGQPTPHRE